jgi:hypothetical protein
MNSNYSEADYRERAGLLVEAGAARKVVAAELVKMGASQSEAKRLSAGVIRRYKLIKISPYFIVALLVTAAAYVVFDWQYALVVGLFSLFGLHQRYTVDKRTGKGRRANSDH